MSSYIHSVEYGACCSSCLAEEAAKALQQGNLIAYDAEAEVVILRSTEEEIFIITSINSSECVYDTCSSN